MSDIKSQANIVNPKEPKELSLQTIQEVENDDVGLSGGSESVVPLSTKSFSNRSAISHVSDESGEEFICVRCRYKATLHSAYLLWLPNRAENKDSYDPLDRRSRKRKDPVADRKSSTRGVPQSELDALRNEVKALKYANKAVSQYASKILDRIIASEGFKHILDAEYSEKTEPASPVSNCPLKL